MLLLVVSWFLLLLGVCFYLLGVGVGWGWGVVFSFGGGGEGYVQVMSSNGTNKMFCVLFPLCLTSCKFPGHLCLNL